MCVLSRTHDSLELHEVEAETLEVLSTRRVALSLDSFGFVHERVGIISLICLCDRKRGREHDPRMCWDVCRN